MTIPVPSKAWTARSSNRARPTFGRIDALLEQPAAWFGAITFVAALQATLIFTHQPWLDEWQALQIALQSPTLGDLLQNLHYEGHPPLWYLILRGLGTVVPPYWVLPTASAVIAAVTMGVILFSSPFSRLQKLCLVTGELVLFEYLTISRSLSLGVCLLLIAFASRRSRWSWLAIALLPMCDFLFGVISAVLVLIQWKERRFYLPGAALWLICGILAALAVTPAPDAAPAIDLGSPALEAFLWIKRLGLLLLPFPMTAANVPQWSADVPLGMGLLLGPAFLVFAHLQLRGDRLNQLIFGGFVVLTLTFSTFVYSLHVRHLSLIALLLILLKWRHAELGERPSAAFDAWLVVGAACGLAVAGLNLSRPFDTAAIAAREIDRLGLQQKHWMAYPSSRAQGVSAITGIEFERAGSGCVQSFVRWDYQRPIAPGDLKKYLSDATQRYGRFYLLTDRPLQLPASLVRTLAFIPAGYEGQEYYLHVVGPNLPERQMRMPRCAPVRRLPLTVDPRFAPHHG